MKNTHPTSLERDSFSSRFGILVAMSGSAIGLGNLWRFPYLVGENGGAAFIIIYLAFVIVLCLPIM
ncbi:MAG: sodium-dependent transporter, partial [Bacteroidales bacterium]